MVVCPSHLMIRGCLYNQAMGDESGPDDDYEPTTPGRVPNPYGALFGRIFADAAGTEKIRQALQASLQPNMPDLLAGFRQAMAPDLSKLFADNHKHLLEQLRPNTTDIMQPVLSDAVVRSWQQPKNVSGPRSEWTPRKFLTANAEEVSTLQQFTSAIAKLSAKHSAHELVWRGQGNADWPVRSTLSRAVSTDGATEDELVEAETAIVESATGWGLHPVELSTAPLHVLAELQHAGAPTRLLDVTRDPDIATWFAIENQDHDDQDGLVIAWGQHPRGKGGVVKGESTSELLNLGGGQLPWHGWNAEERRDRGWGTGERAHVWFPPMPNMRMRVQRGGFMIESGPMFMDPVLEAINTELSKSTKMEQTWQRNELERATSVIGLPSPTGRVTKATDPALVPIFTILIKAEAKPVIREHLHTRGLEPRSLYPDLTGLVADVRRNYPIS